MLEKESRMELVSTKGMLLKAKRGRYAVGAFNVCNMETIQAVAEAADDMSSPVIIAATEQSIAYAGISNLVCMAKAAAKTTSSPVALHVDHGTNPALIKKCIDAGFSSVMIDGSHLSFENNIEITKKVVRMARPKGVSVEGELGLLKGKEDHIDVKEASFTDPDQAALFVSKTGIDSLAVAIGTSHGAYKFTDTPSLDFDRLKEIVKKTGIPIVLHGASQVPHELLKRALESGVEIGGARGVPTEQIRKACRLGVCKINTDTDLRIAFTEAVRQCLTKHPDIFDQRIYCGAGREAVKKMVMAKISLFSKF